MKNGDGKKGKPEMLAQAASPAALIPTTDCIPTVANNVGTDDASMLIARAIDKSVPVETMEKLLAMRRELRTEQIQAEFVRALVAFQSACPVIQKTRKVLDKSNRHRYSFAALEDIIRAVRGLLEKVGLSYRIDTEQHATEVAAICIVQHVSGHSEKSRFAVPIDKDGYMSAPQKVASALTYAKRYAFCNALGIMTGEEDDDAISAAEAADNGAVATHQFDADAKVKQDAARRYELKRDLTEAFAKVKQDAAANSQTTCVPVKQDTAPNSQNTCPPVQQDAAVSAQKSSIPTGWVGLLERAQAIKARLGDPTYYEMLRGGFKAEHANKLNAAQLATFVANLETAEKSRTAYIDCIARGQQILGDERFLWHLGQTGVTKPEELTNEELRKFMLALAPEVKAKRPVQ